MRRPISWLLATLIVGAEGAVFWFGDALATPQLPDPYVRPIICVFPDTNGIDSPWIGLLGATENEMRRFFGDAAVAEPSSRGRKCLRYEYGGGEVITLLLENGRVRDRWLTARATLPESCAGLVERTVTLADSSAPYLE